LLFWSVSERCGARQLFAGSTRTTSSQAR
jgi:hypothetical protein